MSVSRTTDDRPDGQTDTLDTPLSRRGFGKHLLLSASALAVTLAMGKRDQAEAAALTDTWKLGGNTNVNTNGTNFLGTLNVAPLIFKVTKTVGTPPTERMRITPGGTIGIGTTAPAGLLHARLGSTAPALIGENLSTVANAIGVQGKLTSTTPGAGSAAVQGTNSGTNANGAGVRGTHAGSGYGVHGTATNGFGVYGSSAGRAAVFGITTNTSGSGVEGNAAGSNAAGVFGVNTGGPGVWGRGIGAAARGVYGEASTGFGVYGNSGGQAAVYGITNNPSGSGVEGNAAGSNAAGVFGVNTGGPGVWGRGIGAAARGVYGESSTGIGVYGNSGGQAAVYGITTNTAGSGVYGRANGGNAAGVYGRNESGAGVWGYTPAAASGAYGESGGVGGRGVFGVATAAGGIGVRGQANGGSQAFGVYGSSTTNHGVAGFSYSASGGGVLGESPFIGVQGATSGTSSNAQGVRGIAPAGSDAWAGYFDGKAGAKNGFYGPFAATQVDHPLDPANKYLIQPFVQSSDMKSVYDGVITTGADGLATVGLPAYVEALNGSFRYQLTVIGDFAQAIVAEKIAGNRFTIKTDRPNVEVSWQVTGIRKDRYATAYPVSVEKPKSDVEKGKFLAPELYDQPSAMAIPAVPELSSRLVADNPDHEPSPEGSATR